VSEELLPPAALTTIPPEPDPPAPRVEVLEEGYREVRVVLGGVETVSVRVYRRQAPSGHWGDSRVLLDVKQARAFTLPRWRELVAAVDTAIGEFESRFGP
jgi:hypothetical protein